MIDGLIGQYNKREVFHLDLAWIADALIAACRFRRSKLFKILDANWTAHCFKPILDETLFAIKPPRVDAQKYRVFLKKVLHKREEKMQEKMKMT